MLLKGDKNIVAGMSTEKLNLELLTLFYTTYFSYQPTSKFPKHYNTYVLLR